MKSIHDAKINMFRTTDKCYDDHKPGYDVITVFASLMVIYKAHLAALLPWLAIFLTDPKLAFKLAMLRKGELAKATQAVASPTAAYAASIPDLELQNIMNVRASALVKDKKDRLPTISQEIFNKANAVKVAAADYNLTQDLLDTLEAAIPAYTSVANIPRLAHGKQTNADKQIAKILAELHKLCNERLDRLVSTLAATNSTLTSLWKTARTIVDPATKHTPFTITVKTAGGVPIQNAQCTLNKLSLVKVFFTNVSGVVHIPAISSGIWSVAVTADGFQPYFNAEFRIVKGEENVLQVTLIAL